MSFFETLSQNWIIFVFTALADEYSVGRISEVRFVLDKTCSHHNKFFYAALSSTLHLVYVYTMEVVQ